MRLATDAPPGARYRDLLHHREFAGMWAAHSLSLLGDQLARIALAVLVYARTGSPLLTAVTFAASFLPHVLGGPLLAGLADRYPRRGVMVACDLVRAVVVGVMALPGVPLGALIALLFAAEFAAAPFDAARSATVADVLDGDAYVRGCAVTTANYQASQVVGFAVGGAAVALVGTRTALAVDALTFLGSAALLRACLAARPAPLSGAAPAGRGRGAAGALRLVLGDRTLRALAGLAWLNGLWVVPQALAVPYAAHLPAGPVGVGLLLAANPVGMMLGSLALATMPAGRRLAVTRPLLLLAGGPLVACVMHPGLAGSVALWALSGVGTSYNLAANAAFVALVPPAQRGGAFGVVGAGLAASQGLAMLAAGAAAAVAAPALVIAAAGATGLVLLAVVSAGGSLAGLAADAPPAPPAAPSGAVAVPPRRGTPAPR